jgi:5-amino-6-(5-phosphoribosylamino)uracil reductase
VAERPYTLLSCALSLDGYLGNPPNRQRLLLSNDADFDRVEQVRAGCDAILVGAATIRRDNPRLTVRTLARRQQRVARGLPATPAKVTVTGSAELDACAEFFAAGESEKLVYCSSSAAHRARSRFGQVATVVESAGHRVDVRAMAEDLGERGVRRLMVEGGGSMHTQFLTADLVDELQLVVAPFFVGDSRARRFVDDGSFPWHPGRRARLADVRRIDDVVLLTYALSTRFVPTAES